MSEDEPSQCWETGVIYPGVEDLEVSCNLYAGHRGQHWDTMFGSWGEWGVSEDGMRPNELIHPMGCKECGWSRPHGRRYVSHLGYHQWVMPTQKQIKYRMIRRRKWHGDIRWR